MPLKITNPIASSLHYCLQAFRLDYIRSKTIKEKVTPTELDELTRQAFQLQGLTTAEPGTEEAKRARQIDIVKNTRLHGLKRPGLAKLLIDKPLEDDAIKHQEDLAHADEQSLKEGIGYLRQVGACDEAIELLKLLIEEAKKIKAGDIYRNESNESFDTRMAQLCASINPDTLKLFI